MYKFIKTMATLHSMATANIASSLTIQSKYLESIKKLTNENVQTKCYCISLENHKYMVKTLLQFLTVTLTQSVKIIPIYTVQVNMNSKII